MLPSMYLSPVRKFSKGLKKPGIADVERALPGDANQNLEAVNKICTTHASQTLSSAATVSGLSNLYSETLLAKCHVQE